MNISFKKITMTIMVAVIVLSFFNCLEQPGGNQEDANSGANASEIIKSEIDLSGKKIGYCTPSLNAPYYQALLQSIKSITEKNGMIFLSADGQDDVTKQISAVEDLIPK